MDDGVGPARVNLIAMSIMEKNSVALEAAMAQAPDLSIVVVAWNCREMLARCLAEVCRSRIETPFEVIVVDNASKDGTLEEIPRLFPHVRLVANTDNLGFAKANNLGFGLARGRLIMLLNPDAFPSTADTFGRMVRFLDEHSEFAGAGCRLVHADGSHQVGDAGFNVTPGNVLAYAFGLSQLFPGRLGLFLGKMPSIANWIDVDWICGAFFILRRSVVDKVGGLDERYFMYGEDVEWGCRIRREGYRLAYLPGETVIHLQGGTQVPHSPVHVSTRWLDSLGVLYWRLNEGRYWGVFKIAMAMGFTLRALIYRLISLISARAGSRAKSQAMWTYARHMWAVPWWSGPTVMEPKE